MRLIEVQIAATSGINEHNQKMLDGLVESYTDLLFPGLERGKATSAFEDQAKKHLAEEVKKIYRVRRIKDKTRKEAKMKEIIESGTAGGAFAAHASYEEEKLMRDLRRHRRTKKDR